MGYRRGAKGDTWRARFRNADGSQSFHALDGVTEHPPGKQFEVAKRLAEDWFEQMGSAPVRRARRGTVQAALKTYLAWLRNQGREAAAKTAEQRFELIVWSDPLADLKLADVSIDDMREWRDRLRDGRQPRSVNRHVTGVVAGLNRAVAEGHVGNPRAWKLPKLADDAAGGETAVFLTKEQRRTLIESADPSCAAFLRGLELTGARPKELAAARVRDLGAKNTLKLAHRKGRPARLRERVVVLSDVGRKFFRAQAKGRQPDDLLFLDASGNSWTRHAWARDMREAMRECEGIPAGASAYSFRHSRISELLQLHGLDPLTVAQQTGTSVRMLETAYFRFISSAMRDKLAAVDD